MGKGLKYMLVAKYVFPKEYVVGYTGREPPADHGMEDLNTEQKVEKKGQSQDGPSLQQSPEDQVMEDLERIPLHPQEEQEEDDSPDPLQQEDPFEGGDLEQMEQEEDSTYPPPPDEVLPGLLSG